MIHVGHVRQIGGEFHEATKHSFRVHLRGRVRFPQLVRSGSNQCDGETEPAQRVEDDRVPPDVELALDLVKRTRWQAQQRDVFAVDVDRELAGFLDSVNKFVANTVRFQ